MNKITLGVVEKHLKADAVIGHSQYVFMRGESCLSNLVSFYDKGPTLGPVFFSIFMNDLDAGHEHISSKFANDTKPGGAVHTLEGREALQRDHDKSESWVIVDLMKANNGPSLISKGATGKVDLSTLSSQNKQNKLPKRSPVFVTETREIDFSSSSCFIATLMTELLGSLK
ncbi:rna-directed dna polymerase from mobile element jockey-like [Pitangus sulphuratus]|nr:rna-directed dna polymerase from mobile element jockey-like [Pitangus sulphuratus]